MKSLQTVFNDWASQAKGAYRKKQWLLSKWETLDGIDWPAPKIKILFETIRGALELRRSDSFIDIGCGGGWIQQGLKRYVKRSIGLDISIEMLKHASAPGLGRLKNDLVCGDVCQLPFKNKSFSRALCYFVFINFSDPDHIRRAIGEMMRILKKGGRVLIGQIPDRNYSAQYDVAKASYLDYCRKTYQLGRNIRDICVVPVHPLDRGFFVRFLEKEKIAYQIRESFNPFYRPGEPETVDWRFDLVLEKK